MVAPTVIEDGVSEGKKWLKNKASKEKNGEIADLRTWLNRGDCPRIVIALASLY
jgi:hypothetical protein